MDVHISATSGRIPGDTQPTSIRREPDSREAVQTWSLLRSREPVTHVQIIGRFPHVWREICFIGAVPVGLSLAISLAQRGVGGTA